MLKPKKHSKAPDLEMIHHISLPPGGFKNQSCTHFLMDFFQNKFLVGVTGVIFNEKNEVLLFKHTYRHVERNSNWYVNKCCDILVIDE